MKQIQPFTNQVLWIKDPMQDIIGTGNMEDGCLFYCPCRKGQLTVQSLDEEE